MLVESMLAITIVLLLILLYRIVIKPQEVKDLQYTMSKVLDETGFKTSLGTLAVYAREIRENQKSFEDMLKKPQSRGSLGESFLEDILSDQLAPDMFGIRKRVLDGKYPDAHIKSTVGTICIDSKFPLDNYKKFIDSESSEEKERYKREFISNVEGHLEKIKSDYVCPEKDSASFAFAFIPSEGIYWFLVTEAYDLLRKYSKLGVQVVSPLTLSHKIELIKAGVQAKRMSEQAEKIEKDILRLARHFEGIEDIWSTLFGMHLKNLKSRADDFDTAWRLLQEEFQRIRKTYEE